jgi:ribonuclease P protein component
MLAKNNRLNREAFNKVFSQGKRFHGESMQLIMSPSPVFHGSVVVGKKIYGHAVQRNKLRRRIYAMLAAHQKESAYTCIVIVKPTIKTLPVAKIKEEIVGLLKKVK